MANTLIGCGGTGAHVALAFMRLHALGDTLGFFRHAGGKTLELPTFYLVDQDSGDGAGPDKPTAWQTLRKVRDDHPSRTPGGNSAVVPRRPKMLQMTPLPVGEQKDFLADGVTSLRARYPNSHYLDCILSADQRSIKFSRGMMGSPAVGSLLFKLKSYDTRPDDEINHDEVYNQLIRVKGRVAVVGSGVGGTGAAVGPTLAHQLAGEDERHVMAIMLLNWFEFDELHEHLGDNRIRAQRRNRTMRENAASGLLYYGQRLAESVATVPVGIPKKALTQRHFTGDNNQPKHEAYPHAVAAICCLRQFLNDESYSNGLYHLDAEDPAKLGRGTGLPGGGTIGDLADQAETLVSTLKTYEKVLTSSTPPRFVMPVLCEVFGNMRHATGKALTKLRARYQKNLEWLRPMVGSDEGWVEGPFTMETEIWKRLCDHQPRHSWLDSPDRAAFEAFRWLAHWVHQDTPPSRPAGPNGVYWPPFREDQGLAPSPRESGSLQLVPQPNVRATLDSFVDPHLVTQNGWPDPVAAADHFREAISRDRSISVRQLELLFLGLVSGELELRRNERRDNRRVSLDQVVEDHRNVGHPGLARYAVVRGGQEEARVLGFTAPHTLLCPVPDLPESEWSVLWRSVTGQAETDWSAQQWGSASSDVKRIRGWIDACTRRHPNAAPPPWTNVFSDQPSGTSAFGAGMRLKAWWSRNELIDVFLPTRKDDGLSPDIARGLPKDDSDEFLRSHGEVLVGGKPRFWRDTFEIAGEGKVHGIWDDHLRHLQAAGAIEFFGKDPKARELYVVTWSPDHGYCCVTLEGTLLLRRADMGIRNCTPMKQDRVPNGEDLPPVLYPHYPVRSRYFGLVMSGREESLFDLLKRGASPAAPPQPEIVSKADGRQATWTLPMRGRSDQLSFTVKLSGEQANHRAHWMVWPRFHSLDWQAYYVYQHCTDRRLQVDTLWLNKEGPETTLCRSQAVDERSYPVRFSARHARHEGGPPVALCARRGDQEIGLYLVKLERIDDSPAPMQMGIDFGTSHTAAAVQLGDRGPQPVDLDPELSESGNHKLSLHVSENWEHVTAPRADVDLLSQGTWFPGYVTETVGDLKGLWPSELLTIKSVKELGTQVGDWQPVRDYVVPPAGMLREDLADHVIANFKWNTSEEFLGKEPALRGIYLDRILEQVLAETFLRHGRPSDPIRFTFTYPLRTRKKDVDEYRKTLRTVLDRGRESLGCPLELHNGVGLFDESHASKVGTKQFGDLALVGDLGGGTLDLIITAEGKPGITFEDTADSVKLGGNVLLDLLAKREGMLPGSWGRNPATRLTQLAAWMRAVGSPGLFGSEDDRVHGCEELGVRGFDDARGPSEGRRIIRRYFYLVGEFVARSLTAYLAKHWYPKVPDQAERDQLCIRVYLRGNGWRLWHEEIDYLTVGKTVADRVKKGAGRLWRTFKDVDPPPGCERWVDDHHGAGHPKRDVVKQVVNRSEPPKSVRDKWFSHALVDLTTVDMNGRREPVNWFERIPFPAGGEETTVQFSGIRPGLPLSSVEVNNPEVVARLPVELTREINENLQNKGEWVGPDLSAYQAPIAAWVWEAVLKGLIVDPTFAE